MITPYYQQQLSHLRELGILFAQKYPALAPLLSGQSSDPDVERLLEGTAFLSGLIQQRLDDHFPEIIHTLTELIFPHYLSPLPAAAIVRFAPKSSLKEPVTIAAGTALAAREIDGLQAIFTTCADVVLLPLHMQRIHCKRNNLEIELTLTGMAWSELPNRRVRFYLAGEYNAAVTVLAQLHQSLNAIYLKTETTTVTLRVSQGFRSFLNEKGDFDLYPYPPHAFPAFQVVQEYFHLPQKFLFFDICGLEQLPAAEDLTIALVLQPEIEIQQEHWQLMLFCVPVINLFQHHAESILLDHTLSEYRVHPAGGTHYQIYGIDKVVGFQQGSAQERVYQPFMLFNPQATQQPVYSIRRREAQLGNGIEVYLSVAYPHQSRALTREILAIQVRCTHQAPIEQLGYGDICLPTETSPVIADFSNITLISAPATPPLQGNLLWRLLSHLYLNQCTLAQPETLTSLLKLYIFTNTSNRAQILANTKRVEAIKKVLLNSQDRTLYRGIMLRGTAATIQLDPAGFPCSGDLFLFGAILNQLLAAYTTINSYTRTAIENTFNQRIYQWPALTGKRSLL